MKAMKQFAAERNIKIDSACFLSKEVLEDIIKQRPNETGVMATTEASGRGVSNLVVLGRTQLEIDAMLRQEEAMDKSDGNRTYKEAEKQTKVAVRRPPTMYFTLQLNVNTFASLLYVVYGPECDLFKKVWVIAQLLDMEEVFTCREALTAIKCKELTWAIYEECRSFFRKVRTPDDFLSGRPVDYPEAMLEDVYVKVRRQENIYRSTFPAAWRDQEVPNKGNGDKHRQTTQTNTGYGGQYSRTSWLDGNRLGGRGGGRGGGGGGGRGGGAGGQLQGDALKHVHPKILAAFPEFFKKYNGRVSIRNIMEAGGITWNDMPKLPSATMENGKDALCWAKVLGVCKFGQSCQFATTHGVQVPDAFAEEVIVVITPGVEAMMREDYKFPSQKRSWYQDGGYGGGGGFPTPKRERTA